MENTDMEADKRAEILLYRGKKGAEISSKISRFLHSIVVLTLSLIGSAKFLLMKTLRCEVEEESGFLRQLISGHEELIIIIEQHRIT